MATLVTGGTVVSATRVVEADILVEGGKIVAIGQGLELPGNVHVIDAAGCYVMPGGVDVHTHVNLTVGKEKVSDGFYHGSVAAAFGGTTTIVEHPGFGPNRCNLNHQVDLYREQAREEMVVDYGLHGVVQHVDQNVVNAVAPLIGSGVPSLKVYLTYSGRLSDEEIIRVLKAVHKAGGLVAFHAENHAVITSLTRDLRKNNATITAEHHPASRPDYAEAEAINRLLALARAAGDVPVYIVHLSTAAGLDVIRKAQKQGQEVFAETCPQYLCLTEEHYHDSDGLQYIMSPPLRTREDCDALWNGLADGVIEVVATDHCSYSLARKVELGRDNAFLAPGGIPGVETRLPLLFSEGVLKKRIHLNRFVQLVAANPARIMGLAPQKGDIVPGADADLIMLNPKETRTLSTEILHQYIDYTPFAGKEITGWPAQVMLRGKTIVKDYRLSVGKGYGSFVQREISLT
jgi:dihydropyrimidinase